MLQAIRLAVSSTCHQSLSTTWVGALSSSSPLCIIRGFSAVVAKTATSSASGTDVSSGISPSLPFMTKLTAAEKSALRAAKEKKKQAKDLRIKRPPSAFNLYVQDKYLSKKELPVNDRLKSLSTDFKSMASDLKQPYIRSAAELKGKVDDQRAAFRATKPLSAYILYFKSSYAAHKASNPSGTFSQISKDVASGWKGLSSSEKEVFTVQAAKLVSSQAFSTKL